MGARPEYGLGTSAAGKAVPPARPRTLGPLLAAVLQIGVGPRRRFSQTSLPYALTRTAVPTVSASNRTAPRPGRPPRDTGRRAAPLRPEAVADAPRWALPLGRARRSRVQADQALEARRGECSFRVISTLPSRP